MARMVWTARLRTRLSPHEAWTYLVYDNAARRYWRYGASGRTMDCLELSRDEAVSLFRSGIKAHAIDRRPEDDAKATDAIMALHKTREGICE